MNARQFYAEELQAVCGLESALIVEAFASVPRERFLGPGPWQLCVAAPMPPYYAYRETKDADARHVYHNVAIALDRSRILNNGQPGLLAAWMDWLKMGRDQRVVHIGCGTGYFTAVMAEVTGPSGSVRAIEVDPGLAAKARENLAGYSNVEVIEGNGATLTGPADVIFVNAGVTHPLRAWLDALTDGGRMILPLTVDMSPGGPGRGSALKVTRRADSYEATFGPMVAIYPCAVARDGATQTALQQAMMKFQQGTVKSIRTDPHESDATCWVHTPEVCFSTLI